MTASPREILDLAYETIAGSGVLKSTLEEMLNRSRYPEPRGGEILESVITGKSITRDAGDVLKSILTISSIRDKIAEILELEKGLAVQILLEDNEISSVKEAKTITKQINVEGLVEWIHRRISTGRINMVLFHPDNEDDDKSDMRKYSSEACTVFITAQNIGIIFIGKETSYDFKITGEFHTEDGTYLEIIKENQSQLFLSIETGQFLPITSLIAIKHGHDVRIEHHEGKKKEAFIVGNLGSKRTGYILNKGELGAWLEIKNIEGYAPHPEPVLISKSPNGTEYHYHLNS